MRTKSARDKAEAAALLSKRLGELGRPSRRRSYCNYYKRLGHIESKCWTKFPNLNPQNNKDSGNKLAFVVNQSEEDPTICLITKDSLVKIKSRFSVWRRSTRMPRDPSFLINGASILDGVTTWPKSLFSSYIPGIHGLVELGNNNTSEVLGTRTIYLEILANAKRTKCQLYNVLYIPELGYQLLSVTKFDKSGLNTSFHSSRCRIKKKGALLATGNMKGNMYQLDVPTPPNDCALVSRQVWHQRLAHIQSAYLMQMAKSNAVKGLDFNNRATKNMACTGSVLGKGHRQAIPQKDNSRSTNVVELVHSDVNGPVEAPSQSGSRYLGTFIDEYSRWGTLCTMKKKSKVFDCFKKYQAYAKKLTGA